MIVTPGEKGKWYGGVKHTKYTRENWLFTTDFWTLFMLLLAGQGLYSQHLYIEVGSCDIFSPMEGIWAEMRLVTQRPRNLISGNAFHSFSFLFHQLDPHEHCDLGTCAADGGAIKWKESGSWHRQPLPRNSDMAVLYEWEIVVSH